MPEAQWYYADGDIRKGPYLVAELKSIAQSGKVTPESLIWRSGFEDWVLASRVKGLFVDEPLKESKQPETSPEPSQGEEVAEPQAGSPLPDSFWPVEQAKESTPIPVLLIAKTLIAVGLALIILARGCDSLEQRYAESLSGQLELMKAEFDASWDTKNEELSERRDELQAKGNRSASENSELQTITSDLQNISSDEQKEKTVQQRDVWIPLEKNASKAASSRKVHAFYTEILFLLSAMILCTGLVVVSMVGEGHQRWVTLLLLGIILFKFLIMT